MTSRPMRFQRESRVRSACLRSRNFSFEKSSSMGFRSGLYGGRYAGAVVATEIVQHHDVAGRQRRDELLLDVRQEQLAVHRAVDHQRSGQAGRPQRTDEGRRLPMAVRDRGDHPPCHCFGVLGEAVRAASQLSIRTACPKADKQWHAQRGATPQAEPPRPKAASGPPRRQRWSVMRWTNRGTWKEWPRHRFGCLSDEIIRGGFSVLASEVMPLVALRPRRSRPRLGHPAALGHHVTSNLTSYQGNNNNVA